MGWHPCCCCEYFRDKFERDDLGEHWEPDGDGDGWSIVTDEDENRRLTTDGSGYRCMCLHGVSRGHEIFPADSHRATVRVWAAAGDEPLLIFDYRDAENFCCVYLRREADQSIYFGLIVVREEIWYCQQSRRVASSGEGLEGELSVCISKPPVGSARVVAKWDQEDQEILLSANVAVTSSRCGVGIDEHGTAVFFDDFRLEKTSAADPQCPECERCTLYRDWFGRDEIGEDWTVDGGSWEIGDGRLVTSSSQAKIVYKHQKEHLPQVVRVEYAGSDGDALQICAGDQTAVLTLGEDGSLAVGACVKAQPVAAAGEVVWAIQKNRLRLCVTGYRTDPANPPRVYRAAAFLSCDLTTEGLEVSLGTGAIASSVTFDRFSISRHKLELAHCEDCVGHCDEIEAPAWPESTIPCCLRVVLRGRMGSDCLGHACYFSEGVYWLKWQEQNPNQWQGHLGPSHSVYLTFSKDGDEFVATVQSEAGAYWTEFERRWTEPPDPTDWFAEEFPIVGDCAQTHPDGVAYVSAWDWDDDALDCLRPAPECDGALCEEAKGDPGEGSVPCCLEVRFSTPPANSGQPNWSDCYDWTEACADFWDQVFYLPISPELVNCLEEGLQDGCQCVIWGWGTGHIGSFVPAIFGSALGWWGWIFTWNVSLGKSAGQYVLVLEMTLRYSAEIYHRWYYRASLGQETPRCDQIDATLTFDHETYSPAPHWSACDHTQATVHVRSVSFPTADCQSDLSRYFEPCGFLDDPPPYLQLSRAPYPSGPPPWPPVVFTYVGTIDNAAVWRYPADPGPGSYTELRMVFAGDPDRGGLPGRCRVTYYDSNHQPTDFFWLVGDSTSDDCGEVEVLDYEHCQVTLTCLSE